MSGARPNRLAVLLNDPFADWEVGFLTATACDFFQAKVDYYSPLGHEAISEGGLRVRPSGAYAAVDPKAIGALVVCGSGGWMSPNAQDVSALLNAAVDSGAVLGVICAGTLTAARAGLFKTRRHTSNGRDWLKARAPSYGGDSLYQDVNDAVADGGVISAPESAPAAFARAMLAALYPDHPALPQAQAMLSKAN